MKRTTIHIFAAIALLLGLAACTQDEAGFLPEGAEGTSIVFTATGLNPAATATAGTRAPVDGNWEGVQSVAVLMDGTVKAYDVTPSTADPTSATLTSTDPYYWTNHNDITVTAWWPYTEGETTPPAVKVKANQSAQKDFEGSVLRQQPHQIGQKSVLLHRTHRSQHTRLLTPKRLLHPRFHVSLPLRRSIRFHLPEFLLVAQKCVHNPLRSRVAPSQQQHQRVLLHRPLHRPPLSPCPRLKLLRHPPHTLSHHPLQLTRLRTQNRSNFRQDAYRHRQCLHVPRTLRQSFQQLRHTHFVPVTSETPSSPFSTRKYTLRNARAESPSATSKKAGDTIAGRRGGSFTRACVQWGGSFTVNVGDDNVRFTLSHWPFRWYSKVNGMTKCEAFPSPWNKQRCCDTNTPFFPSVGVTRRQGNPRSRSQDETNETASSFPVKRRNECKNDSVE